MKAQSLYLNAEDSATVRGWLKAGQRVAAKCIVWPFADGRVLVWVDLEASTMDSMTITGADAARAIAERLKSSQA